MQRRELLTALHQLADFMGVATRYQDGLDREVTVEPETLVAVCAALGAPLATIGDSASALRSLRSDLAAQLIAPTIVAWDGVLPAIDLGAADGSAHRIDLTLEDGTTLSAEGPNPFLDVGQPLPLGYHRVDVQSGSRADTANLIAAPRHSWHPPHPNRGWGVAAHLAALRSSRSRSVGDLADLQLLADWVVSHGGGLVSVLPLLPTFNEPPAEPSPYSPVSRLFWSELILDLGTAHRPQSTTDRLRLDMADAEVRAALREFNAPDPWTVSDELARYAQFRAAQKKLGRDWRTWPTRARLGILGGDDIDRDEERFQLVAQTETLRQLAGFGKRFESAGGSLGLDLAVGVHPEGYDAWSRAELFAPTMSVGAPPDAGFPSGQSWGFQPILPQRSRLDGHAYFASCVAHQAALAGVLRIDHVMAMSRLYWIPEHMDQASGTYVDYPSEELFAVLCLESHRHRCELIGENLGTVPADIEEALPRHRIWGMYVTEFSADPTRPLEVPTTEQVAMIDTHDTPTFTGWLGGHDIDERVRLGLTSQSDAVQERAHRQEAVRSIADDLGGDLDHPDALLSLALERLAASPSPLVMVWLEDLWLEATSVNVPGSNSSQRSNWLRPISGLLEDRLRQPEVNKHVEILATARDLDGRGRR